MEQKTLETTKNKIESRGFWSIRFTPQKKESKPIGNFPEMKQVIKNARVSLRGWDYPHYPTQSDEKQKIYVTGSDHIESWIDWAAHKEIWKFYQSVFFEHFLSLREDWFDEDPWITEQLKTVEPCTILDFINTTYTITEIYKFLENLMEVGLFSDGIEINIDLHNTRGRKIIVLGPGRAPILGTYWSHSNEVRFSKNYDNKDLKNPVDKLALETIVHILHQFNWDNPPEDVIQQDQKKLLERRL